MKQQSQQFSIIAIIPARGGSKGIPLKNIQPLCGKPLIAHSIEAAKKSKLIEEIYVSTDHADIASQAERYGARTIKRPDNISGDMDSSENAIIHALKHIGSIENYSPDICVFLQCTSPLTSSEDIDGTIEKLISNNADSALAVTNFHYFIWKNDKEGNAAGINHDKNMRVMRQERDDQFLETGAVYVFRVDKFMEKKHRFFGKISMYIMPGERCFEIDDPIDMKIAEVLICEKKNKHNMAFLPQNIEAVIFDFDGVFTDNSVIVKQNGEESVICSRGDGMGISIIKNLGIPMLVLSSEKSPVVEARCNKLQIEYRQGLQEKEKTMIGWLDENNYSLKNVIYVGNDINDIECLKIAGCSAVVGDAMQDAKNHAKITLSSKGGHGAIRELADMIKNKMEENKNVRCS